MANTISAQEVYNSSGRTKPRKQKEHKGYDPSKLVFGGSLNAGFGGGYVLAGASPIIGYRFTNHLAAGIGFGYLYQRQANAIPDPLIFNKAYPIQQHAFYPGVWVRHNIYKILYGLANFEYTFVNYRTYVYDQTGSSLVKKQMNFQAPCLFLGLGVRQPLSPNASFFAEVSYDVLQDPNSPYPTGTPLIRLGVLVGF